MQQRKQSGDTYKKPTRLSVNVVTVINSSSFVFSGTGTQYRLVFPEALACRETD